MEFAVVLPLLVALLLGIFEFARVIVLKNILSTSVSRTASLAAVLPNLEAVPKSGETMDNSPENEARAAAINQLRQSAKQLPLETLFGAPDSGGMAVLLKSDQRSTSDRNPTSYPAGVSPEDPLEVILPEPEPGQTLEDALTKRPIILKLHARIDSILPLIGPFNVTSSTAVFREPKTYSSQPIALDCNGDPLKLGVETTCPCQADPANPKLVHDYATGGCRCAGELRGPDCTCPGNLTFDAATARCSCKLTCGPTQYLDAAACDCKPVICGPNAEPVPYMNTCQCSPLSCQINERQDQLSCECSACPNAQVRGADPNTCDCEPVLSATECAKVPNTYLDPVNCSCVGCPAGKEPNPTYTGCECREDPACPAPYKYQHATTCQCTACTTGQVVNESKDGCKCPGEYGYQSYGECHCNWSAGRNACRTAGKGFNYFTCSCDECPAGKAPDSSGNCVCSQAAINACKTAKGSLNPVTCECAPCAEGYLSDSSAQSCICATTAACRSKGMGTDPATCQCVACAGSGYSYPNQNGFCECNVWEEDDPESWCAQSGKYFNYAKCDCDTCPGGLVPGNYGCTCPIGTPTQLQCNDLGQTLNSSTCACEPCPANKLLYVGGCMCDPDGATAAACAGNTFFNKVTCACESCPEGRFANPAHTACTLCDKQCAEGEYLNVNACACVKCPAGAKATATGCVCDPAQHPPCPGYAVRNPQDGCACNIWCDGDEEWPSNLVPNADRTACICPPQIRTNCTGAKYFFEPSYCECSYCGGGRVASADHLTCTCPAEVKAACTGAKSVYYPTSCSCSTCPDQKVANEDHSACVCPATAEAECMSKGQGFDSVNCRCYGCPVTQQLSGSSCTCRPDAASKCTGNTVFNPATCLCNYCSYYQSPVNGQCVCDPSKAALCGLAYRFDPTSCSCRHCGTNKQHTADYLDCECSTAAKNSCTATQYFDAATCTCKECGGVKESTSSGCVCPADAASRCGANQTFDAANCACMNCPADYVADAAHSECRCSLTAAAAKCPAGSNRVANPVTCNCDIECVSPRTPNALKTACECAPCTSPAHPNLNPATCECDSGCPNGMSAMGALCCPNGYIVIDGHCADPACATTTCSDDGSGNYTVPEM